MVELLSRLPGSDLSAVLIIVPVVFVVGTLGLAGLIATAIQRHRDREIAAAVVAEMLDRGIAPEEIIAVLKAIGLEGSREHLKIVCGCACGPETARGGLNGRRFCRRNSAWRRGARRIDRLVIDHRAASLAWRRIGHRGHVAGKG